VTDRPDDRQPPWHEPSSGEPQDGSPPQDGSAPQPPQYGTPPAYGSPPYGTPPPAYGALPPYGAPPAYGAPPPYGAPPAYGAPPTYGAPPYGAPPYGGGYQPETPEQSSLRHQAIAALVVNGILVVLSCLAALPSLGGVITAAIAIGQVRTDPVNARRLVRWSWGLLAATVILTILLVGFVFALALATESTSSSSDPTFRLGLG
jgi:hypothetical protein